ncbi:LPXTG cell wall anchor domain-containing protein [Streptococcus dysgalactiae]|uniref:LPXTG cell wall anchor domain-containing protein n=1 Tax=Streptococcus dysgalactiae TaxID=1334 RepID=UPI000AC96878|nr:LPXTG cell wall anchor domain-containing protein [Streptococcus dysgalactiae]
MPVADEEPAQEDVPDTTPEGQSTPEVDEVPAVDEEPAQEDALNPTPEGQPTPEVDEVLAADEEPAQEDTPDTISEGQLTFEGDEPTTKEEAVRTEEEKLPSVTDETKVLSSVKVVETSEGSSSPSSHVSEKKLPTTGETKGIRMSVLGLLLAGLGVGFMKRKKAD